MKVQIAIKEELIRKGIETICLEEGYQIVENPIGDFILIARQTQGYQKEIIIFSEKIKGVLSNSKIKLLDNVMIKELKEALICANRNESYIQSELKKEIDKIETTNTELKGLSKRQSLLINDIIDGLSNKEIAKKMYLSEKTIKNNLTDLYKIVNVKNRDELTKKCKILLTQTI